MWLKEAETWLKAVIFLFRSEKGRPRADSGPTPGQFLTALFFGAVGPEAELGRGQGRMWAEGRRPK